MLSTDREKTGRIPLVVTYHPTLPSVGSITKRHQHILQVSERLKDAFPLPPLIAFCRPKNLRDLLVRAELSCVLRRALGNCWCGAVGCKICPTLVTTDVFTIRTTGRQFEVNVYWTLISLLFIIYYMLPIYPSL